MSQMATFSVDVDTVRDEFSRWKEFLNNVFGVASFTLALACLGTHQPSINACICCVFLVLIRVSANRLFPPSILQLRREAKRNEDAAALLKSLERDYLGVRTLFTGYPVFLMGWFFLVFVMGGVRLAKIFPQLNGYFGF
jgi:hypothetical protein